ncbi:MAG: branched-chain amino acid transaminase [Xanthomonadaceae bacterium]|nr:branched-chain amino acid transaminase [Xanthomonadaceae bacterium]
MSNRGSQLWYNGKILSEDKARISLFTHALHYGTGAFEGIRAYKQKKGGGGVFRLKEHMERLVESFHIMGFELPYTAEKLVEAAVDVCKANNYEECYLRPLAFIGDGPLGVFPGDKPPIDIAVMAWEWGKYLGAKGENEGTRLVTSSWMRPQVNTSLAGGKMTGQYLMGVVAKREAVRMGFDEALMLDTEGFFAEGTGENLFIIKNNIVKTTPLTSILSGITRSTVMEYFKHQGKTIVEQRFTRDELFTADEVFLTGTAAEITPVKELDNRLIGKGDKKGKPGPITTKLKTDYANIVRGELPEYGRNWLTTFQCG